MIKSFYQTGGVNTFINPVDPNNDGVLIHATNVDSFPLGAKTKRFGYDVYLNQPDADPVKSLWRFAKNNGTQFWNYRASGSIVYYSEQGTGDWTVCGNGTITDGRHVGHAILADTMIVGDGEGSTRHTTNGTSFTNTTLAPIANYFEQYQNRIHAQGTASNNFYSSANDPTNWQTSGTSDSSSFVVPGEGKLTQSYKIADRLILPKNHGQEYAWDGYALADQSTERGLTSPFSIDEAEGYKLYLNRFGIYGNGGGARELLSAPIQRQFQSNFDGAILGSEFNEAPGCIWYNNYYVEVGDITDEFTKRPIDDAIIKFDFQKNEFLNWSFGDKPTAMFSAVNADGYSHMYFGDAFGNTFEISGNFTSDSGKDITSEMVFFFTHGAPHYDKEWKWWRGVFNPGCQARIQIACSDIFEYTRLKWVDLGDAKNGFVEHHFPDNSRSKFLFVRVYEASSAPPWSFYGQQLDANVIEKR